MKAELVLYDAMCRAIAEVSKIDEVKEIRDKAMALAVYAKQAQNFEAEHQASEIRIRAERKAGQLLKEMQKAKGGYGFTSSEKNRLAELTSSSQKPIEHGSEFSEDDRTLMNEVEAQAPTLAEMGIKKFESFTWQKLAGMPEELFESQLAEPGIPNATAIINALHPKVVDKVDLTALWLWGRLLDFERDGVLKRDPETITDTMLEHMKRTVRDLAPQVAAWLGRIPHE